MTAFNVRRHVVAIHIRAVVLACAIVSSATLQLSVPVNAASPINNGDLVVSHGGPGTVDEYTPSGTLVQNVISGMLEPTGSAFDAAGNLYVTDFLAAQILKRDASTGTVSVFSDNSTLGNGHVYDSPESIAFSRGFAAMYVSDANAIQSNGGINVVDPSTGHGVNYYPLPSSNGSRGQGQSDWVAFSPGNVLFMTNENPVQGVMQVNQATGDVIQPSFAGNLPKEDFGLAYDRLSNVWVADTDRILEFSPQGALLATVTQPGFAHIFVLAFSADGKTLYAGDTVNGIVFSIDPSGGNLKGQFNTGSPVTGLTVAGAQVVPPDDPSINASGTIFNSTEGSSTSVVVGTFTDPDPSAQAGEYSALILWGDGNSSAGTITGPTGGPFTITGSNAYAEEGTYPLAIAISDNDNPANTAQPRSTARVADAALTATGRKIASENPFAGRVATFTDADPHGTLSDYTATILWGDGIYSLGVISTNSTGGFNVSGSHRYAKLGSYSYSVFVKDAGGSKATAQGTIVITLQRE